jgi:hypothetical protein
VYRSLALRAAQEMLLLFPGESLGMSAGCIVKSIEWNFLRYSETRPAALTSLFTSRASIARKIYGVLGLTQDGVREPGQTTHVVLGARLKVGRQHVEGLTQHIYIFLVVGN